MIFDPPDGRLPPLNAKGQQHASEIAQAAKRREAAQDAQSMSLAERCISWGTEGPPMVGATYNANLQIFQNGASLAILHEMIHGLRVIPLDGRPHLPQNIRNWNGDSVGHWEGKTLVVDTTNFSPKADFMGSAENLHLVERFTRVAADEIRYQMTVDDPATWTKPWTAVLRLKHTDEKIFEVACHEGNFEVMVDMLRRLN